MRLLYNQNKVNSNVVLRPLCNFWNKGSKLYNSDNKSNIQPKYDYYEKSKINVSVNINNITKEMYNNRKLIDFYDGMISFEHYNQTFNSFNELSPHHFQQSKNSLHISDVSPYPDPTDTEILKVKDNKLILTPKKYYKIRHHDGIERIYGASNNSFKKVNFIDNVLLDRHHNIDLIMEDTVDVIQGLISGQLYPNMTDKEITFMLKDFGFKPGVIEIGIGNKSKKYLFSENGEIRNLDIMNDLIGIFNNRNHMDWGIPKDSKWVIGGNEFHMDEYGYFELPNLDEINMRTGDFKIVDKFGNVVKMKEPGYVKKQKENINI